MLRHIRSVDGDIFYPVIRQPARSKTYIKHLMTCPEGNSEFCFPKISMFPETKTKQKQNLKTALRFQRSGATAGNISRVTVNCFPFDVVVFAMLPAHGVWRETVSLLDVM